MSDKDIDKKQEKAKPAAKKKVPARQKSKVTQTKAKKSNTDEKIQNFYDVSKLLTTPHPEQREDKTMTNTKTQYEKFATDAQAISREGVEAFVKSGSIWAKGCEQLMRESMTLAQSAAEKQSRFAKEAMACKTINEFADVQNKILQANFDDFMAGATKISELSSKVLTDSAEPISKQAEKTIKKASEQMAA